MEKQDYCDGIGRGKPRRRFSHLRRLNGRVTIGYRSLTVSTIAESVDNGVMDRYRPAASGKTKIMVRHRFRTKHS